MSQSKRLFARFVWDVLRLLCWCFAAAVGAAACFLAYVMVTEAIKAPLQFLEALAIIFGTTAVVAAGRWLWLWAERNKP